MLFYDKNNFRITFSQITSWLLLLIQVHAVQFLLVRNFLKIIVNGHDKVSLQFNSKISFHLLYFYPNCHNLQPLVPLTRDKKHVPRPSISYFCFSVTDIFTLFLIKNWNSSKWFITIHQANRLLSHKIQQNHWPLS